MTREHAPGAICIASGELARYPHFTHSIINCFCPAGTTVEMHMGLNVAANFNAGVRRMMANPALQWAWIMGDDHEFDPTTLLRLLDHELDIVVPLVVRRQPPFIPVLFKEPKDDTPEGQFPPFHWDELPQHGLVEVYTCGSAGMLIRRPVLDALGDPWFEMGKMGVELTNEDTHFCLKAQRAGFKIYSDVDVTLDHWTPVSFRPTYKDGTWTVAINLGKEIQVSLPPRMLSSLVTIVKEESKEGYEYALKTPGVILA